MLKIVTVSVIRGVKETNLSELILLRSLIRSSPEKKEGREPPENIAPSLGDLLFYIPNLCMLFEDGSGWDSE